MAKHKEFYDDWRWRNKTAPQVKSYNPQCQRIFDTGEQCIHHSEVVHHLIAPDVDPNKGHDWRNLVAVCNTHHPAGQRGETMGYRYCATIGVLDQIYYHPGGLLPTWHKQYVRPQTGDISRLAGTSSSSVGEDAIDRALAAFNPKLLDGM
jgi:hypothetical protein